MRKLLLCGVAGLGMTLAAASASASPIAPPIGPSYSKFDGVEQFSPINATTGGYAATSGTTGADCVGCINAATQGGEGNWGVGVMSTIFNGTVTVPHETISSAGTHYFDSTPGGSEILFMFYGIHINSAPGTTPVLGNGGVIDLYWWDTNNVTQSSLEASDPTTFRTAQNQFTGVSCANAPAGTSGCTLLARLDFVPGAQDSGGVVDPTVTVASAANPATGSGQAVFYAEVDPTAGGAWASSLAGQWFSLNLNGLVMPDIADIRNRDSFDPCGTGCAPGWGDNRTTFADLITDPTQAFAVPEPASIALFGAGLLGLGMFSRRRQKRTDTMAG